MAVAFYLLARLLRTDDPRLWPLVGLVLGLGLMTKYTVLDIGLGVAVGVILTRTRSHLTTPWPWLAAGIALAMLGPNLVWQGQHDWPTLEYLRNHQADKVGTLTNHDGIRNQEYGRKIYLCGEPRGSLDAMWPDFKLFR